MNGNTKRRLQDLADAVAELAKAVILQIGMDAAQRIVQAAEDLKSSLDKDETILD